MAWYLVPTESTRTGGGSFSGRAQLVVVAISSDALGSLRREGCGCVHGAAAAASPTKAAPGSASGLTGGRPAGEGPLAAVSLSEPLSLDPYPSISDESILLLVLGQLRWRRRQSFFPANLHELPKEFHPLNLIPRLGSCPGLRSA